MPQERSVARDENLYSVMPASGSSTLSSYPSSFVLLFVLLFIISVYRGQFPRVINSCHMYWPQRRQFLLCRSILAHCGYSVHNSASCDNRSDGTCCPREEERAGSPQLMELSVIIPAIHIASSNLRIHPANVYLLQIGLHIMILLEAETAPEAISGNYCTKVSSLGASASGRCPCRHLPNTSLDPRFHRCCCADLSRKCGCGRARH